MHWLLGSLVFGVEFSALLFALVAPYFFGIYSVLYAWFRLRRAEVPPSPTASAAPLKRPVDASSASSASLALPGVTIIKPVKGLEWNLRENLRSFFVLDYPNYEIVFCFASKDDKGLPVAEQLLTEFPNVRARITVGESNVGVNPKVNNIYQAYKTMSNDYLWLSDSNVYAEPGTLLRAAQKMQADPTIGLAHQVPVGLYADSFGADLEAMYYATSHARMYVFISGTDVSTCVMGKSMLFRKTDLERAGGIEHIGKYLAEDNRIGEELHWLGYRHILMDDLLTQPLGKSTATDYIQRRIRWIRLRWSMGYLGLKGKVALTLEPLVEAVPNALICAALFWLVFGVHPLRVLATLLPCWFLMDVALTLALQKKWITDWPRYIKTWIVRELLYIPMFAYAISGRTFDWRGQVYIIREDGTCDLVDAADADRHHDQQNSTDANAITNATTINTAATPTFPPSPLGSPSLKQHGYSWERHGLITLVGLALGILGILQFAQI